MLLSSDRITYVMGMHTADNLGNIDTQKEDTGIMNTVLKMFFLAAFAGFAINTPSVAIAKPDGKKIARAATKAVTPPGVVRNIVHLPTNPGGMTKQRDIDTTVKLTKGTTIVDLSDKDGMLSIKLPNGSDKGTGLTLKGAFGTGTLDLNGSCVKALEFNIFDGRQAKIEHDCTKPGNTGATVTTNFDMKEEIILQAGHITDKVVDGQLRKAESFLRRKGKITLK